MNKVILMGNLGQDPEVRTIPNGTSVVSFSVATSRRWNNRDGQKQEETTWHNVEAWGKVGEVIAQYFSKGSKILLDGRLKVDSWEDKETGQKRYKTKVVLENFHFVGSKGDNQGGGYQGQPQGSGGARPQPNDDDDIPF
jgi:single-strand DNA-binding protein